ncbi:hypothetical protein B0H21DRAFT_468663 [Amylocystis lapponica]|nr:hypothetical protein B0H21DRAFT_468663 [Amylocystis lapponica]
MVRYCPFLGKTCFLYYYLVKLVLEGTPVIFYNPRDTPHSYYMFSGSLHKNCEQVSVHDSAFADFLGLHPEFEFCIALCDSYKDFPRPPAQLLLNTPFIVQAASPQSDSWKEVVRRAGARLFWTQPWSWEEVYAVACRLQGYPVNDVWRAFAELGPSIRCAIVGDEELEYAKAEIRKQANSLVSKGVNVFVAAVNASGGDRNVDGLFVPIPDPVTRRSARLTLPSAYIESVISDAIESGGQTRVLQYLDALCRVPECEISCGRIWENWVVRQLKDIRGLIMRLRPLSGGAYIDVNVPPHLPIEAFDRVDESHFRAR